MSNYLYNGIELPDINEAWTDKETYPYAQIALYTNSTEDNTVYILRLLSSQGTVVASGLVGFTSVYRYNTNNPEKGWHEYNFAAGAGIVVWANYDVYYNENNGGGLFLAASIPILVVNTEQGEMYLYNGIELPALPEYDKTAYPYVYMARHGERIFMHFTDTIDTVSNTGTTIFGAVNVYEYTDGDWVKFVNIGTGGTVFWSNADVYYGMGDAIDEELRGTLYLSASQPVLVVNTEQGRSYLYNGIELPALPEYDITTYPYALIFYYESYGYVFAASDTAKTTNSDGNVTFNIYDTRLLYRIVDGVWTSFSIVVISGEPTWANYDILNADGSVYLAASKPILLAEAYSSYVHNGTWQKGTFYKRINNEWVKHQAYRRQNGVWVEVKE